MTELDALLFTRARRIADLIFIAQSRQLTNEEFAEITEWLDNSENYKKIYKELSNDASLKRNIDLYQDMTDMQHSWDKVAKKSKVLNVSSFPFLFVGAASLLIVAASIFFFYLINSGAFKHTPAYNHNVLADIRPGGNKAILTLSDGRVLALDSLSSGLLAQQGSVHVLKSAQGQVDYRAGGSPSGEVTYNTMTTPRGGTFKLTLSDGTKVWLNAGSSLRYPVSFNGLKERRVELSGEAYLEVAANKSSLFYVEAGKATVKVLGTHFDVMAYSDEKEIQTTLLEGGVAVSQDAFVKVLRPGQQARITQDGALSVFDVDADDYVAWKDGLIDLHHSDLAAVMRQISRWYDVEVVYEGSAMPSRALGGVVPRTLNLSEVLKVLKLMGINYRLEGRKLTVILSN